MYGDWNQGGNEDFKSGLMVSGVLISGEDRKKRASCREGVLWIVSRKIRDTSWAESNSSLRDICERTLAMSSDVPSTSSVDVFAILVISNRITKTLLLIAGRMEMYLDGRDTPVA